jgi:hypothetical protein
VKPRELRIAAEQIIDLCDPIFAENSTDDQADEAVSAIVDLINKTVTHETEELRAALDAMVRNHRYRFPLSGICHCDACQQASTLVNGSN